VLLVRWFLRQKWKNAAASFLHGRWPSFYSTNSIKSEEEFIIIMIVKVITHAGFFNLF